MRRKVLACFTGCFTNRSASATEYYDPSDKGSWSTNRYMPATTAYILLHTTTLSLGRAAPMPAGSDGTGGFLNQGNLRGAERPSRSPQLAPQQLVGPGQGQEQQQASPPAPPCIKEAPGSASKQGQTGHGTSAMAQRSSSCGS